MTDARHWAIIHRARPISMNDYRRKHWRDQADHEREWRNAGFLLAKEAKLPKLAQVRVEAIPFGNTGPQDPGNCYPSVKALLDGLVDAGVIVDDTGEYVTSVTMLPWRKIKAPSGLELHIYEVT